MKRDFSESAKQRLLSLVKEVEDEKWSDVTDWIGDRWYDVQAWAGFLDVTRYVDDLNKYHKKVIDKNNTQASQIEQIFSDVNQVSTQFTRHFVTLKADLTAYTDMLKKLAESITPQAGAARVIYNGKGLAEAVNDYLAAASAYEKSVTTGLSEDDLEAIGDEEDMRRWLDRYVGIMVDTYPDLKIGDEVEIPLGPGISVYYTVDGKVEGSTGLECESVINDQKLELKKFGATVGDFKGSIDMDGQVEAGVETDEGGFSMGSTGISSTQKRVIGDNTYEYKYDVNFALRQFTIEEKVTTDVDGGSVSSAIGIKFTDNDFQPMPEPVPVTVPYPSQLPEFDPDWEAIKDIAITTTVVVGTVVVIGAAIYFTGGIGAVGLAGGSSSIAPLIPVLAL